MNKIQGQAIENEQTEQPKINDGLVIYSLS
jgi:hypothetical protein